MGNKETNQYRVGQVTYEVQREYGEKKSVKDLLLHRALTERESAAYNDLISGSAQGEEAM